MHSICCYQDECWEWKNVNFCWFSSCPPRMGCCNWFLLHAKLWERAAVGQKDACRNYSSKRSPGERRELICPALSSHLPSVRIGDGEKWFPSYCVNPSFFPIELLFDFLLCFSTKLETRISLLLLTMSHHNRKCNFHFPPCASKSFCLCLKAQSQ